MDITDKYQLKAFLVQISDTNYFNEIHKILRIKFGTKDIKKLFDFKYIGGIEIPNPSDNYAMIFTSEEVIDGPGLSEDRLSFIPGIIDSYGTVTSDLPIGFAFILPKNQTISTTNPNSGGAGFSVQKTNMFDIGQVALAISPPIQKDYTNPDTALTVSEAEGGTKEDVRNNSIGLFINKNGTILIKSKGSSITMGEEGTYFSGPISWEASNHQREWMMDNPFQLFIPSTIPTAAVSIPALPNITKFAQIAEGARKVRNVLDKISKVSNLIKA